jgi:hypothetical protein
MLSSRSRQNVATIHLYCTSPDFLAGTLAGTLSLLFF